MHVRHGIENNGHEMQDEDRDKEREEGNVRSFEGLT